MGSVLGIQAQNQSSGYIIEVAIYKVLLETCEKENNYWTQGHIFNILWNIVLSKFRFFEVFIFTVQQFVKTKSMMSKIVYFIQYTIITKYFIKPKEEQIFVIFGHVHHHQWHISIRVKIRLLQITNVQQMPRFNYFVSEIMMKRQ